MNYEKLKVTLGGSSEKNHILTYRIRSTASAQLWAQCVKDSMQLGLMERDRFYGFPGHPRNDLSKLIERTEQQIQKLKSFHPDLDFPALNPNDLSSSIAHLHQGFAHSHHVTKLITPANDQAWGEFNVLLHAMEVALEDQKFVSDVGVSFSFVVFTWLSKKRIPIPENSYKDFALEYSFGTAYMNYSEVGRHLKEMYDAKDDSLDDAHIRPSRVMSGDTLLWFGATFGHVWSAQRRKKMETWFTERADRFHRLGLKWDDPRLALGHIPVAQLSENLYTLAEIREFQRYLSEFDRIVDVQLTRSESQLNRPVAF